MTYAARHFARPDHTECPKTCTRRYRRIVFGSSRLSYKVQSTMGGMGTSWWCRWVSLMSVVLVAACTSGAASSGSVLAPSSSPSTAAAALGILMIAHVVVLMREHRSFGGCLRSYP